MYSLSDLQAGLTAVTDAVDNTSTAVGEVRVSYDKIVNSVSGTTATPTAIASKSDNPLVAVDEGEDVIDSLVDDKQPFYKKTGFLLAVAGGLGLFLIFKVMRRRGK